MKYTGGCHCGNVRFEVDMEIDQAMSCNCSICSKKGHLLTFVPEENFNLLSGEDSLSDYQFNKKIVHHYFCKNCGISSFSAGTGPEGKLMRGINIRCLDNVDIGKIPIMKYDGKNK